MPRSPSLGRAYARVSVCVCMYVRVCVCVCVVWQMRMVGSDDTMHPWTPGGGMCACDASAAIIAQ